MRPARSLAGLATKLRVACEVLDMGDAIAGEELVASALCDVDRLLGRLAND